MTWLVGWLRELILVVLLAAFVEMLLPSKSMERYARLVLSLLVLLTMLSPIVSFLKGDATSELSLAMEQQDKAGGLVSGAGKGAGSLEKILADGRMLAAGAREQSLKLAAEEVAGQMREQIAGSTGIRGAKVTVTLGMGKAADSKAGDEVPVISAVTVSLPAAANAAGTGGGTGSASSSGAAGPGSEPIMITPVEPVQVSLGGGDNETPNDTKASAASAADPAAADGSPPKEGSSTDEAESIVQLLEKNWSLDREVIKVQSGASAAKL